MKLSDFDYELPEELIAQYPARRRDESRLIVMNREQDEIRETHFGNFPRYLRDGDLLVLNETKVLPVRLYARRRTGGKIEIFLTRCLEKGEWLAMLKPAKRLATGEKLTVEPGTQEVVVLERAGEGEWRVRLPSGADEGEFLDAHGHMPLPPYIKRSDGPGDRERYQTIFARHSGSVAAPTAGLHFTGEVLRKIKHHGVTVLPLTLHVGVGTFRPLKEEVVEENDISAEYVRIRKEYIDEILGARHQGRRVVAVGTTTTRALESIASGRLIRSDERSDPEEIAGWTDLFIHPGYRFEVVDALLTNMHLPRSSLLVLVSAFAGRERILRTYRWAVKRRYRFYSYGDVMFIE
jgi:S-adenosylmethionine:tRNA ribosyltransferase-isomerase